jgi:hypothetical protein
MQLSAGRSLLCSLQHCSVSNKQAVPHVCLQVETVEDYDLYCHYVAGLVGIGLSQLFGEQTCRKGLTLSNISFWMEQCIGVTAVLPCALDVRAWAV